MEEETNLQLRLPCSKHPLCGMVCVGPPKFQGSQSISRGQELSLGSPANEDTPREGCKSTCLF